MFLRRSSLWLNIAVLGVVGASLAIGVPEYGWGQTPDEADAAPVPTPASSAPTPAAEGLGEPLASDVVGQLVRDLDDDRFAIRETAQQQLQAAGPAVLPAVAEAAAYGSLEASTRAVSILVQWAQSDDNALSLGALEALVRLTNRPAEAAMASEKLADVRERAAMEQLVALGGRVEYDRQIQVFNAAHLPLQVIIGPKWKGGLEGMSPISAVRRATTLSFHTAAIDADAAASALPPLVQLQRIEFYGTPISEETVANLRKAMPNVAVEVRSGARLGIAGTDVAGGAQVTDVQAGSAAEKAGLMPGDVITEISYVAVGRFEELTREIAKAAPGDRVRLKVLRVAPPGQLPAAPVEIEVQFDRWGDEQVLNPAAGNPLGGVPMGMPMRPFINRR